MKLLTSMCAVAVAALLATSPAGANPRLAGEWQTVVDGAVYRLAFDGQGGGQLGQQPMRYVTQGQTLVVEAGGKRSSCAHELRGGQLHMQAGDGSGGLVWQRADAAAAPQADAGSRPAELLGSWCWISTTSARSGGGSSRSNCFRLYPDGRYAYTAESSMSAYAPGMHGMTNSNASDAGTWSVNGGILTAVSPARGTQRFRLGKRNMPNGDPLLCLNDDCFVTQVQRPSW